jgi:hypothetical protein
VAAAAPDSGALPLARHHCAAARLPREWYVGSMHCGYSHHTGLPKCRSGFLNEKIIQEPWLGVPTKIAYAETVKSFIEKEEVKSALTELKTKITNLTTEQCADLLCSPSGIDNQHQNAWVEISFPENKVLCFSPPRSVPYEKFKTTPMNNRDNIIMSEIVEGVMVNLFYEHRTSSWEIATKCAIGGDYNFSGEKSASFREMFFECLHCKKNDVFLDAFPKNYSYSFVIQHPKNKIILSTPEPKLYLVAIYAIYEDNSIMAIPSIMYEDWEMFKSMQVPIYFPVKYNNLNSCFLKY